MFDPKVFDNEMFRIAIHCYNLYDNDTKLLFLSLYFKFIIKKKD